MPNKTVDQLVEEARTTLDRVEPLDAHAAVEAGEALLVDIRAESQREADGVVPGAQFIPRNVIEWRAERLTTGKRVVVMCDGGYQSSLVAATLQELGLEDATDLAGGFQAWRGAELPVEPLRSS